LFIEKAFYLVNGLLHLLLRALGDRRYHLTPLGEKAISVLHSMTQNLENGYEKYLNSAKATRSRGIATWVNRWFYVFLAFTVSAMLFLVNFVRMRVIAGLLLAS
jgi:hypothetical protein